MADAPIHTALHVVGSLNSAIHREQRVRDISQRAAAREIGIPVSVLSALLSGADPKLTTVIKILQWLDTAQPIKPPDGLTKAARAVLDQLIGAHGLGECWLRVEARAYGLLVPDADGTLGELSRVRGINWATWGELEAAGLVQRGLPTITPPARGPRNRNRRNEGWPIEIITSVPSASVMLDPTPTEGALL